MSGTPSVRRVRHELKLRELEVVRVTRSSPALVTVTLGGPDLADFVSASFDDHVKVFFPAPGQSRPALPTIGPNGIQFPPDQPRPEMRDFTPRRFDPVARTLDLEFVLHHDGPAATWARQAAVGQRLGVGGPRGSFVVDDTFDWYLLVGDAAALPAIGRRLEELPAERTVITIVNARPELRPPLARSDVQWTDDLVGAVRALRLPPGTGHAWAAGESSEMKQLRAVLLDEHRLDKRFVRVSSYWKAGTPAVHETFED